jgi:N-acetylmuramoyl-L-alanine amidase
MRNKCLFSLGLVFAISLTSMVAFAFSFVGTPADEVDSRDIIVQSMISDEANATPTAFVFEAEALCKFLLCYTAFHSLCSQ